MIKKKRFLTENIYNKWLFLGVFMFLGMLVAGSIFVIYQRQASALESFISIQSDKELEIQRKVISMTFKTIIEDVIFMSKDDALEYGIKTNDYSKLIKEYSNMAGVKTRYSQLRFIDKNGREIVRVDRKDGVIFVVPEDELQDKSGRYYVKETLILNEGDVYVSPIDLNIEHGIIEDPVVPMLRFSSPVYLDGELAGMVIINYFAESLLKEIESIGSVNYGDLYLLNSDGYYILSPDPDKNWGFMYPDKKDFVFERKYPDLWKKITSSDSFIANTKDGLVVSLKIKPLENLSINEPRYYWFAVNVISGEWMDEKTKSILMNLFILGAFLFLISALPAWFISQSIVKYYYRKKLMFNLANFDQLTGLPNRIYFYEHLKSAVNQAVRYNRKGALFFLDLDGFKQVNDKYGHDTGDKLLKEVAERIKNNIRSTDVPGRLGGDEFVIIYPFIDNPEIVKIIAEKILKKISDPYFIDGKTEVSVGVSIGIRMFPDSQDGEESPEEIIKDADTAMYEAKESGKGRFRFFEPDKFG